MAFSWIFSIITNPKWATVLSTVLSGMMTFFAALVALYKDNWRKPKIKVEWSNFQPYVIYPFSTPDGMLFRLKIINKGKTVARNCQVKLLSVKSIKGENVLDKEELDILKWSGSPRDMCFRADPSNIKLTKDIAQLIPIYREKKDISPMGGSEFCDIFWVNNKKKVVFSSSGERNFFCEKEGRYFAVIEISGDNIEPTRKGIRIYTPLRVSFEKNDIKMFIAGIEEVRNIS